MLQIGRQPTAGSSADDDDEDERVAQATKGDAEHLRLWRDTDTEERIEQGCILLILFTIVFMISFAWDLYVERGCAGQDAQEKISCRCKPENGRYPHTMLALRISSGAWLIVSLIILVYVLLRHWKGQQEVRTYFVMVIGFSINLILRCVLRNGLCGDVDDRIQCLHGLVDGQQATNDLILGEIDKETGKLDARECALQGQVDILIFMMFITLCPRILVSTNQMYALFLWIVLLLLVALLSEASYQSLQSVTQAKSILWLAVLLSLTQLSSLNKKMIMQKGARTKFVYDLKQRDAGEKMFNILGYMVPEHVILPMIKYPGEVIAEHVSCASILFVMFVDFDQYALRMSPQHLLNFLNSYFTEFDLLCARYRVSKIETVGEEYVCAVGVVPSDRRIDAEHGHADILGRLVRAASKILELQWPPRASTGAESTTSAKARSLASAAADGEDEGKVAFKMGVHTGPIVAGVIGAKLPRFRLFGDTINTAARMMQKGVPGELQFGEETRAQMPSWVKTKERGEIEMKGKGQVMTYWLDREEATAKKQVVFEGVSQTFDDHTASKIHARGSISMELLTDTPAVPPARGSRKSSARRSVAAVTSAVTSAAGTVSEQAGRLQGSRTSRGTSSRGTSSSLPRVSEVESVELMPFQSLPEIPEVLPSAGETTGIDATRSEPQRAWVRRRSRVSSADSLNQGGARPSEIPRRAETEVNDILFEEVMIEVSGGGNPLAAEATGGSSFFSSLCSFGKAELKAETEEAFRRWFHINSVTKKLDHRVDFKCLLLSALTAAETILFCYVGKFACSKYEQNRRLVVILCCRGLCGYLLHCWRYQVLSSREKIQQSQQSVQILLMLSHLVMAFLLLASYSALSFDTSDASLPCFLWFSLFVWVFQIVCLHVNLLSIYSWFYLLVPLSLFIIDKMSPSVLSNLHVTVGSKVIFLVHVLMEVLFFSTHESELREHFLFKRSVDIAHKRIGDILNTLMPPQVVQELRDMPMNLGLPSHRYSHATIAQSDLVGFTKLASTRTPREVVEFVQDLFGLFDMLTDRYDVYKVETVGDAYIAGQGDAPLTYKNSPFSVVLFGLEMVKATHNWSRRKGVVVSCRVGIHTGECVGGIVGTEMQRYHLFGELMNGLEVLESTAPPGQVQCSSKCKRALETQMAEEGLPKTLISMEMRTEAFLSTSKGETHDYSEVGGPTYVIRSSAQFCGWIGA